MLNDPFPRYNCSARTAVRGGGGRDPAIVYWYISMCDPGPEARLGREQEEGGEDRTWDDDKIKVKAERFR